VSDLKTKYAPHLKALHNEKWFNEWIKDAKAECPVIPLFDPKNHDDDREWKHKSGMIEGYKLLLSHLGVKINE
jgi:hypothetical protein